MATVVARQERGMGGRGRKLLIRVFVGVFLKSMLLMLLIPGLSKINYHLGKEGL